MTAENHSPLARSLRSFLFYLHIFIFVNLLYFIIVRYIFDLSRRYYEKFLVL